MPYRFVHDRTEQVHLAFEPSDPDFTRTVCDRTISARLGSTTVRKLAAAAICLRLADACPACILTVDMARERGVECLACDDSGEMTDRLGDRPCTECEPAEPAPAAQTDMAA